MGGTLAADIPSVTFTGERLDMNGKMTINAFDGTISVSSLALADMVGSSPRLSADVEMRRLDLALLTKTFKFGSMEGRIDADVQGLQLASWKPVAFDAKVVSSPGDYPKKISQQAVQNISSLGGAGASAAIQRSFLQLFEQFGYQRLGLSCKLTGNVCEMSGIESTPEGYVIVKGGGVPAINVLGYNKQVGWSDLVERLSRITQENAQPIIK
jgi:hypothetical protein